MVFARPLQRTLIRTSLFRSHFHANHCLLAARKSLRTFKLADIGEGITECEIIRWAVKERSAVQSFDPLCEVQSDKASVEITSPYDGVVKQFLVGEGEVAKVGQGLCLIEVEDEDDTTGVEITETTDRSPVQQPIQAEDNTRTEAPQSAHVLRQRHPLDPANVATGTTDHVLATPSVRQRANTGGRDGRVERKDVEAYISSIPVPEEVETTPSQEGDAVVDLGRTRYGMWKAMVQSLEIPRFGYVNGHHLERPSSSVPESGRFSKMTYLPFLLKTLAISMMEWPLFRASITPVTAQETNNKPTLTIRPTADLALALSTPTGLYTPTISSTQSLSLHALASRVTHLAHLGRQVPCGLTVKDMPRRGGTISVSNVGAVGKGEGASPVLIPGGGVAIVAIGRAKWVWDVSDEFYRPNEGMEGTRRLKIDVSWSADHRVVEGAELAAFVETWRGWVENPERLTAEAT
ncbi:2-oxoacid dehydrogenases acyltransferase-domain-containing protein [Pisolithus tinctorius]|nr:2-oxoacid dehydrogenases acyltransferase-domain-containing protein [Pisolithus tinctorius]